MKMLDPEGMRLREKASLGRNDIDQQERPRQASYIKTIFELGASELAAQTERRLQEKLLSQAH